jgi:peptidoglycan hydrolase-like protein with peptidoglycan-binding domain
MVVQHVHGSPRFAVAGEGMRVRGIVLPYVPGQTVRVRFYRDGRRVQTRTARVAPVGNGAGEFHVDYTSPSPGVVWARGEHARSTHEGAFSAKSAEVRYVSARMSIGASGPSVGLLQSELAGLHYVVPRGGVFDEGTARAVIAYRKVAGLARVPETDAGLFRALQRGSGAFHVRYARDGRHVEADLTRQVLAEVEPHGRVRAIYTMSSGKPSTPTVTGSFTVYEKTPGVNQKGMVDSNYFIRGYAIHGYAEVPTYAASHGCLRVPIPDAPAIFSWVGIGTRVDVYDEGGGGSHNVSGNAGP